MYAEARQVKHDFADQAVAVAMQTAGCDSQNNVPGRNRLTVDQVLALDVTDAEARQVVFAARVNIRHDRRLATHEGAVSFDATIADAADDLLELVGLVVRHGDVVEE